ncbi:hypothetical protein AB1Y20_014162 [Prymnesium parvum]|uniref:DH domain-containing protein n=1 Tax=Prymnesium parvum TaxID=97485 RepID=A0AB34ID68_PRYPA
MASAPAPQSCRHLLFRLFCLPSVCFRRRTRARDDPHLTQPLRDDEAEPPLPAAPLPAVAPLPYVARDESAEAWPAAAREQVRLVTEEIVSTERTYVADLEKLAALLSQLEAQPHPSGLEFAGEVHALLRLHREALAQLEALRPSDGAAAAAADVARVFSRLTPYLRVYSSYCAGCTSNLKRVASLRTPEVERMEAEHGERLDSLLIKPVQRLCKYPLFFDQLLQHFPASSSNQPELARVAAAVRQVNEEINGKVRSSEEVSRLLQLFAALAGQPAWLLAPTRRLVHEAEVQLLAPSAGRASVTRRARPAFRLVVLSDALLLARVRSRRRSLLRRVVTARPLATVRRGSAHAAANSESPAAAAALRLKAVLPLHSCRLAAAESPASPASREQSGAVVVLQARASLPHASRHERLAELRPRRVQCRAPAVQYSCVCKSDGAARQLVEAFASAAAQLSGLSNRRSEGGEPSVVAEASRGSSRASRRFSFRSPRPLLSSASLISGGSADGEEAEPPAEPSLEGYLLSSDSESEGESASSQSADDA